jgi:hypothetical protein
MIAEANVQWRCSRQAVGWQRESESASNGVERGGRRDYKSSLPSFFLCGDESGLTALASPCFSSMSATSTEC